MKVPLGWRVKPASLFYFFSRQYEEPVEGYLLKSTIAEKGVASATSFSLMNCRECLFAASAFWRRGFAGLLFRITYGNILEVQVLKLLKIFVEIITELLYG